jgi:ABC-type antimicrobial peptide transport system permease subunit
MLFLMFAGMVFLFAFMEGAHAGFVGGVIGLVVGLALASAFYVGVIEYLKRAIRGAELWRPGISDPKREDRFVDVVLGWIFMLPAFAWFIACSALAAWLTDFLIRCWQSGGWHWLAQQC